MKKIEWFSLVLIILWCFAFIVPRYIGLFVAPKYLEMNELEHMRNFTMLIAYSQYGVTCLVQIATAVWLFLAAKREKETPWVWALLGLTYGVLGAILFFGYRIHQRLNENRTSNTNQSS